MTRDEVNPVEPTVPTSVRQILRSRALGLLIWIPGTAAGVYLLGDPDFRALGAVLVVINPVVGLLLITAAIEAIVAHRSRI